MLLRRCALALTSTFLLLAAGLAHSDESRAGGGSLKTASPFELSFQGGVDYWRLGEPPASAAINRRLFLADSTPQWNYRNPAPWLTFEGHARGGESTQFNLKYRANQSSGSRLDEASMDWALSPFVGLRTGVVDFKTSWCRTYDIDSPWVRENDPFCTVRTTDQATGAAPGVQAYVKTNLGSYDVQAIGGLYRPTALGYDKTEFNSIVVAYGSEVQRNHKAGLSLNLLNMENASEFRVSWLHSDQAAHMRDTPSDEFYQIRLKGDVLYLGMSAWLGNNVKARLSHLRSNMTYSSFSYLGDQRSLTAPPQFGLGTLSRKSSTLELTYQPSAQDVWAAAYSVYPLSQNEFEYSNTASPKVVQSLTFSNKSLSMAWRHDFSRGFFTSVQWTRAAMAQLRYSTPAGASKQALGIRLGYGF